MDQYIEYLEQLKGYLKKKTGIGDVTLWKDSGEGLRIFIDPGDILRAEGIKRDFFVPVRVIGSYECWKQIVRLLGQIDDIFNNCFGSPDPQTIKIKTTTQTWVRIIDDTNIIYENTMIISVARISPTVT